VAAEQIFRRPAA